ncbi:MAG: hypothetical protein P8Q16_09325 [Flavobacteriales bacterium]|nr:hypothetical protein [Flavobacteriales bacterium]
MKNQIKIYGNIIALFLMFSSLISYAQVGIGTVLPNANSSLDLQGASSVDKGFVLPLATSNVPFNNKPIKEGTLLYSESDSMIYYVVDSSLTSPKYNALSPWFYNPNLNSTDVTTDKNVFIGGTLNVNVGAVFNEASTNVDFRVESDGNDHMLFVDGSNNKVGIGTATPGSKLQVNGESRFSGTNRVSHFNYSTTEDTYIRGGKTNSNVFINDNGGKVGIGTTSPSHPLDVVGAVHCSDWFRTTGNGGWYSQSHGGGWHMTDNTWIRNYNNKPVYLKAATGSDIALEVNGRVGVGTASPSYKLDVVGSVHSSDWFKSTGNGGWRSAHGGGWYMTDPNWIRNYGDKPVYLKAATTSAIALEVSGRVGIGTASPSYPLHVFGHPGSTTSNRKFISETYLTCGTCTSHGTSTSNNFSIYTSNGILTDWVSFHSDKRIKDVIGVSNSKEDLSTLISIEVTDYKRIDKILYGEKITKKLIAQQVKSVFPEAVRLTKDIIPNIYELAEIKGGYIALETDLEKGDRVKLIFEEDEQIVEVVKTNKNGFFIDNENEGKVFVYGIEVDDFHVVDYDAISMLNVSATQELHKIITSQQKIIQNLKNQLSSQATKLEETKINQLDFEARLKSLENKDNLTSSNEE